MTEKKTEPDVVIFSFEKKWDLPSFDVKCLEMQTFCQLSNIDFVVNACNNPSVSPNQKLPMVLIENVCSTDTRDTFRKLANQYNDIDKNLSSLQKIEAIALQSLLNEQFYWAILFNWWNEEENFEKITLRLYSSSLPFPANYFVRARMRSNIQTHLKAIDFSESKIVYRNAEEVCEAMSVKLGNNKYLFGENPSFVDATLFSMMAIALYAPMPKCDLRVAVAKHPNLVAYVKNILATHFNSYPILIVSSLPKQPRNGFFAAWHVPIPVPNERTLTYFLISFF